MNQVIYEDYCLPKFFKVYQPGTSGDDLEVPVSFNICLPKSLPKKVTIRSIYGKIWETALMKCGGDVEIYALVNGWKRISKDEALVSGDVLEFEFDGSRCFNFSIYEPRTMCKRLRRSSVQSEEKTRASDDNDDDSEDVSDAILEDGDVDDQRQHLDDPDNPFFPVTLNPKKRSQLRIPAKVIKDYGLNFPESVTLVDPLAQQFGTLTKKIKIQLNGCVFVKGYGSILRRNKVKSRDKMICELKTTGSNNLVHTIKLHVLSE